MKLPHKKSNRVIFTVQVDIFFFLTARMKCSGTKSLYVVLVVLVLVLVLMTFPKFA